MLEGIVEFTVEEANHQELLWVVRALGEAEMLVAEDEHSRVRVLVLTIDDVLFIIQVYTGADLFHMFRA